jgi:hypothetical protein
MDEPEMVKRTMNIPFLPLKGFSLKRLERQSILTNTKKTQALIRPIICPLVGCVNHLSIIKVFYAAACSEMSSILMPKWLSSNTQWPFLMTSTCGEAWAT